MALTSGSGRHRPPFPPPPSTQPPPSQCSSATTMDVAMHRDAEASAAIARSSHPRTCALIPISGAAPRVSPLTAALGAIPAPLLPFPTPDPPSTATGFTSPAAWGSTSTFPRWLAYPAPLTRVAGRGWVRDPLGMPDPVDSVHRSTPSLLSPPQHAVLWRLHPRRRSVGSTVQYASTQTSEMHLCFLPLAAAHLFQVSLVRDHGCVVRQCTPCSSPSVQSSYRESSACSSPRSLMWCIAGVLLQLGAFFQILLGHTTAVRLVMVWWRGVLGCPYTSF